MQDAVLRIPMTQCTAILQPRTVSLTIFLPARLACNLSPSTLDAASTDADRMEVSGSVGDAWISVDDGSSKRKDAIQDGDLEDSATARMNDKR
jgi:hypothetical protein